MSGLYRHVPSQRWQHPGAQQSLICVHRVISLRLHRCGGQLRTQDHTGIEKISRMLQCLVKEKPILSTALRGAMPMAHLGTYPA